MTLEERLRLLRDGVKTVPEAQELTRLSRGDLYARMARGEIAYVKLGRRRFLVTSSLMEMLARGLVARTAE